MTDAGADDDAAWLDRRAGLRPPPRPAGGVPVPAPARAGAAARGRRAHRVDRRRAGDPGAVPLAFGWHPWLSLPGVPRAEWELSQPERTVVALDERKLPAGGRHAAPAERAPLGDRALDVHAHVAEDARYVLVGRRARDRGRVGGRLPLRPGLRPRRAGRRLPGADDGADRRALHRRGAPARLPRSPGTRYLPRPCRLAGRSSSPCSRSPSWRPRPVRASTRSPPARRRPACSRSGAAGRSTPGA